MGVPVKPINEAFGNAFVFDRHAITQQRVKAPVGLHERRRSDAQDFAQGLFARIGGNGRIQSPDGIAQTSDQHDIAERIPLRRRFAGRKVRALRDGVAEVGKPRKGSFFHDGFVEV
jgi:hypothetical protein